ncbi:MAG: efflux RND transporter periplasmic adaptor subunit [Ignavibacteriae bacterium]|jgi:membrane fusion protein (multidrug efflux system)|nr:efflux RND transporter periplasmic adaptor subunit [Ignavibacteriota bacterium]NOG97836.1 efflux RND transporter periplasmic adaptor subunit [Ignavibacteriota bacterium]
MKKKYIYWSLAAAAVILLALPKITWQSEKENSNSFSQNRSVSAEVLIVSKSELSEKLFLNASLMGDEEIDLRSEISGKVTAINFKEGSRVKKGDLLVKIYDKDLQAQLDRIDSQLKLAEEKEYRSRMLLEQELISQEEYDILLNELKVRKADKALLEAQIEKTEIRAPFSGIVGLRSISEGSFINSSVSIAILTKTDPIKIDFALPIKHADKVKTGTVIKVSVPNSEEVFKAEVYAIDPKIDPTTRTLKVRARTENKSEILLPGSYAEIEILINENAESYTVPTESVIPDISGEMVYLYKSGKAMPVKVEMGMRTNTQVQILNGISEGDTVITSAIIQLRPGINVSIKNYR